MFFNFCVRDIWGRCVAAAVMGVRGALFHPLGCPWQETEPLRVSATGLRTELLPIGLKRPGPIQSAFSEGLLIILALELDAGNPDVQSRALPPSLSSVLWEIEQMSGKS